MQRETHPGWSSVLWGRESACANLFGRRPSCASLFAFLGAKRKGYGCGNGSFAGDHLVGGLVSREVTRGADQAEAHVQ